MLKLSEARQTGKVYQAGILSLGAAMPHDLRGAAWWRALIEELRDLNYVQGRRYEDAGQDGAWRSAT